MSTWTAPEDGWYVPDPDAHDGWRKLGDEEGAALDLGPVPDDRPLVHFDTTRAGVVAWAANRETTALPNGQTLPSRTMTIVFDTEPLDQP